MSLQFNGVVEAVMSNIVTRWAFHTYTAISKKVVRQKQNLKHSEGARDDG